MQLKDNANRQRTKKGKPRGNSLFPGQVIKYFGYTPKLKKEKKNGEKIVCFTLAGLQICRGFKEHDLFTCGSKLQVVVSLGS